MDPWNVGRKVNYLGKQGCLGVTKRNGTKVRVSYGGEKEGDTGATESRKVISPGSAPGGKRPVEGTREAEETVGGVSG